MTDRHDPYAVEYRRRGLWRDGTFLDDLRRQARQRPHKTAVAGRRVAASRTDTLDYGELARLTDRFAGALLDLGVRRGDFVAVQLPNRWEMVPLMFACMRVGAVICPISPICPEDELRHRLGLTEARVCVTVPDWAGSPRAAVVAALRSELPNLEHVLVVGGPQVEGTRDFHAHFVDVAWERDAELDGQALTADEPFVVLFTSGTTGESKGVLHSQNTLYGAVQGYVDTFGLDQDLVAAVSTPLVHYSGFVQGVLVGVHVGGTTVFQDVKDDAALLDLVQRHGATLLYGPPSTLSAVVAAQRAAPHDLRTLGRAVIGSAPVLPQLVEDLRAELGAQTHSLWGMSEFGPVTITHPADPANRAGHSNGRAIDGMEVRIDPSGIPSAAGDVGRLWVRGAAQSLGYYKREDVFAAEFGADGWFDTGDLARPDGHGGIRIVCRARDAIVRSGDIVPMVELEAVLASHPTVTEAAVVGLPADGEDSVCAVVTPADGPPPTLERIRDHARAAGHAEHFLPDRLEVVAALPKTLTGKIRKAELRRRYAGT